MKTMRKSQNGWERTTLPMSRLREAVAVMRRGAAGRVELRQEAAGQEWMTAILRAGFLEVKELSVGIHQPRCVALQQVFTSAPAAADHARRGVGQA
jgi:hypothetical protein